MTFSRWDRDPIIRRDFPAFVEKVFCTLNPGATYQPNWHLAAIFHRLDLCQSGAVTRQIITMPPRSLKSMVVSVAFVAFVLGHDPTKRFICVSYGQDLALTHARHFRTIVTSDWYRKLFPAMRNPAKDTETEFETRRGGFRLATSVGGSLTGRGGNFIIIDDPLKAEDAMSRTTREAVNRFYGNTLYSRLDDKAKGVIIVVMQRLHHDDLVGFLSSDPAFHHLDLPAIATRDEPIDIGNGEVHHRKAGDVLHEEREPRSALEDAKRAMGSAAFQAQYQQAPVPEEGQLIKQDWLRYFDRQPDRQRTDKLVQSWDTAMKGDEHNDYSVCTTWLVRDKTYMLTDLLRRHCDFPSLKQLAVEQYQRHRPDAVLIEDHGSGTALMAELRAQHNIHPIAIRPEGDKVTRLSTASLAFESGQVSLPKEAPWLGPLLEELLRFPQSRFDDQVDSVSQFLNWQRTRKGCFEVHWI